MDALAVIGAEGQLLCAGRLIDSKTVSAWSGLPARELPPAIAHPPGEGPSSGFVRIGGELFAAASDISRIKEAEDRLHRPAYLDSLSGLPNRAPFMDRPGHSAAH